MRRPTSPLSWRFRSGNANSTRTTVLPATASARRSAARRISGPSGTASDRGQAPAVDRQADAVDVGARGRAEEGDHAAGLVGAGKAAGRNRRLHLAADVLLAPAFLRGAVGDD